MSLWVDHCYCLVVALVVGSPLYPLEVALTPDDGSETWGQSYWDLLHRGSYIGQLGSHLGRLAAGKHRNNR